jgi:predicted nucleic acid-binding protein
MPFVLDASVTAVWALADEASPLADLAAQRLKYESAIVPPIWWYEVRNILTVNERRRRIGPGDTAQFLKILASFPIQIDPLQDEQTTFDLARQYSLSFYDAAYLAVAHRHCAPLATLDRAMEAAAGSIGVSLLT